MFVLKFEFFKPTVKNLELLHENEAYESPFVIRTHGDRFFTVKLKGTDLKHFYFETVYGHLIDPSQVTHIQVKQVTL